MIRKCLTFDPFSRISLEDVLKHPWLENQSFDWLELTENISLTPSASSDTADGDSKDGNSQENEELNPLTSPLSHDVSSNRKESGVVCGNSSSYVDASPGDFNVLQGQSIYFTFLSSFVRLSNVSIYRFSSS